ncbi:MAG: response regulator [Candidatus Omnitrophica bacterium]|nr:response regulator [Candidatus Omnitrophota bacterium]
MDRRKVLVVDDEPHLLKITKLNLERTGKYEVRTLSDSTQTLAEVSSFQPDVILLDILMPDLDGFELCRQLKAGSATKNIPVIALSALDTDHDRQKMAELGAADFLIKPIEKQDLIDKIEGVLGRDI